MASPDTRRLCEKLFERLDWAGLGDVYCDEGGEAFWDEHRDPALAFGLRWAEALERRLGSGGGSSLYVGAAVAELPALLFEARELGRFVVATNLRATECELVNAGLRAVGVGPDELRLQPVDARARVDEGPFDHLGFVSVLTDPERFPTLSGVAYGRLPPVLLDTDTFERERAEALDLVVAVCGALSLPALVTTTSEEVPWIMRWAGDRGAVVEADDETVESAVVGDPFGFLMVSESFPSESRE
jgi:hypothetical protein